MSKSGAKRFRLMTTPQHRAKCVTLTAKLTDGPEGAIYAHIAKGVHVVRWPKVQSPR